jgi:hypothetical protein
MCCIELQQLGDIFDRGDDDLSVEEWLYLLKTQVTFTRYSLDMSTIIVQYEQWHCSVKSLHSLLHVEMALLEVLYSSLSVRFETLLCVSHCISSHTSER